MKLVLHPTEDRLIVRAEPTESMTASGLVIPEMAQEKSQRGEVIAVGPDLTEGVDGAPALFEVGDKVLYSKYGGVQVTVNREDLLILRKSDVLAKTQEVDDDAGS